MRLDNPRPASASASQIQMRVVQLVPELNEGSVERGTVEMNREFVKRGLESVVICRGGRLVDQIRRDGGRVVEFDVCSKNPLSALPRVWGLRKLLRRLEPDVVDVHSRVPARLAYLANRRLGYPFVTTVHGLNSPNRYSAIMAKGDRVICVSEVVKAHIQKHYGTPDSVITVIQRGVDLRLFDPAGESREFIADFCNRFGLAGRYVVTSIGRITWLKDYETFIEAVGLAVREIPQITGLIVGGVSDDKRGYFEKLKQLAVKRGVESHIVFAGSQQRMPEIYALSDVVVNASLKMGNVARTVTEALAMDKPVLATTYEGLRDIIRDGVNGYIIETKDPQDLARKIILTRAGGFRQIRQTLKPEFTLEAMVEQTIGVYRQLR